VVRAAKKTYVADFLAREYQVDKEGAREALFGPEPKMDELSRPEMREGPKARAGGARRRGPGAEAGGGAGPWGERVRG
jgi:hypothetical protein